MRIVRAVDVVDGGCLKVSWLVSFTQTFFVARDRAKTSTVFGQLHKAGRIKFSLELNFDVVSKQLHAIVSPTAFWTRSVVHSVPFFFRMSQQLYVGIVRKFFGDAMHKACAHEPGGEVYNVVRVQKR